MAVHAPQKEAFYIAKKHHHWLKLFELGSALLAALLSLLTFLPIYPSIEKCVDVLPAVLLIVALYLKIRFQLSYREAESIRRDSLIDNSFGTKLAETKSVKYYDNEEMSAGLQKLLSSIHESSALSLPIVNKMFWKQNLINLVSIVCLVSAYVIISSRPKIFLALFIGFMSLNMIGSSIELYLLKNNISIVSTNCKSICENHLNNDNKPLTNLAQAYIIRECLRYENALSYASIMFDNDAYQRLNKTHIHKWQKIKERYYK